MSVLMLVLANAQAGGVLACPASLSPARDVATRDLYDSLALLDPAIRPELCGRDSEIFLAVSDSWDADPRLRFTRAFAVCAHEGADATWTRVSYFRRWPNVLGPSEVPEHARRVPVRRAMAKGVRVEGGAFPVSAVEDLQGWLRVFSFWELPSEFPGNDGPGHHLGVRVVRARLGDRENTIVGGDFCSPLPNGVDTLAAHMLNNPDPVQVLTSYRQRLRERLGDLGQTPPGP